MDFARGRPRRSSRCSARAEEGDRHDSLVQARPEIFTELRYDYTTLALAPARALVPEQGRAITLGRARGAGAGGDLPRRGRAARDGAVPQPQPKPLHPQVIYIETERDDIGIELAMQYNDSYADTVFSFVNNINTHEGGTHLTGLKSALTRVINSTSRSRAT
jgi:DNA gyrase subunit B